MTTSIFDRKFGADLLAQVGRGPGVYRYSDAEGVVIYVGKAKNLKRRLANYRNAGRKKAHRKMLRVIRAASQLSYEELASEEAALLRENELILQLRPKYNIEGAFDFLYPAIGIQQTTQRTLICFTTAPELYYKFELTWYGTFRSRARSKEAFDGLVDLLGRVGHREGRSAIGPAPKRRGSRLVGFRRLPPGIAEGLPRFFQGEDSSFLGDLARSLLAKPRALREARLVEDQLRSLKGFFDRDAAALRKDLNAVGRVGSYIAGNERDALRIRSRAVLQRLRPLVAALP